MSINKEKEKNGTFVSHLSELRSRLIKSFFFLIFFFLNKLLFF